MRYENASTGKRDALVWLAVRFLIGGVLTGILPIIDIRLLMVVIPLCVTVFASGNHVQQRKWVPLFVVLLTGAFTIALLTSMLLNGMLGKTYDQQVAVVFAHGTWFVGALVLYGVVLIVSKVFER